MPYILSPLINTNSPGMWAEGPAYEKSTLYSVASGKLPRVNYEEHLLRCHSLTHLETPAHTQADGRRLGSYFEQNLHFFFGKTVVIKLPGNKYQGQGNGVFQWIISQEEIMERLNALGLKTLPSKLLITTQEHPLNQEGYHDPNYVLTLSEKAARFLTSDPGFHLYGTSWKSSDFNPGRPERPIHDMLFAQGLILENLLLKDVPEGIYFMSAVPLPLAEASESPVVPVLYTKEEMLELIS